MSLSGGPRRIFEKIAPPVSNRYNHHLGGLLGKRAEPAAVLGAPDELEARERRYFELARSSARPAG